MPASSIVINLPPLPVQRLDSVETIPLLRGLSSIEVTNGQNIVVDGSASVGDGGGGLFVWAELSTADDDGETVIKPNDVAPLAAGRWVLTSNSAVGAAVLEFATELAGPTGATKIGFDPEVDAPVNTAAWFFKRIRSRPVEYYEGEEGGPAAQNTAAITASWADDCHELGFGEGVYPVNPLSPAGLQGRSLIGCGPAFASQLQLMIAGDLINQTGTTNLRLEGLTLFALPELANARGVVIDGLSNNQIFKCLLYNFSKAAVQHVGTLGNQISGCIMRDNLFLSNAHDGSSAQFEAVYSNDFHYEGNQYGAFTPVTNRPNVGVRMQACSNGSWSNDFVWEATQGVLTNGCKWNKYDGIRVEQSQHEGWITTAGYQNRFLGIRLNDNGEAAANSYDNIIFDGETNSVVVAPTSEAWDYPGQTHRNSYVLRNNSQFNTFIGMKSLRAGTSFITRDASSSNNQFDAMMEFTSNVGISAGQTRYLGPAGSSSSSASAKRLSGRTCAFALKVVLDGAPGGSDTVTATIVINGFADPSLQCVITGAATSATGLGSIEIPPDSNVCVRLIYSGTAATSVPQVLVEAATL